MISCERPIRVFASFPVNPALTRQPGTEANSAGTPFHSHSIVSGTYNHLKIRDFLSGSAKSTLISTAKQFRLGTIDGDRCRTTQFIRARALRIDLVLAVVAR